MRFATTLAHNSFLRVANTGVVFLVTVLLSRLAGPEGYGLFSLLLINVSFFNLLTTLGSDAAITFKSASGKMEMKKTISFIQLVVFFQICCLAGFEAFHFIWKGKFWFFAAGRMQWAWAGLIFFISISLVDKYAALLHGLQLYTLSNKIILTVNMVLLAVMTGLWAFGPSINSDTYILMFIAAQAIQAMAVMVLFHRRYHRSFVSSMLNRREVSTFISYGSIAFLVNLVQFLAYRFDFWIVDIYQSQTEVGLYALAVRLAQLFWVLPLLYASIIFPLSSNRKELFNHQQLALLVRLINAVNIAAALLLSILASWLLPFIFGSAYEQTVLPFQILLPGVILFSIATVLAAYFAGTGDLRTNLFGSVICTVTILGLDLLLIPNEGIAGAAVASSIGYAVTTIYFVLAYSKHSGMHLKYLLLPGIKDLQQIRIITQQYLAKKL